MEWIFRFYFTSLSLRFVVRFPPDSTQVGGQQSPTWSNSEQMHWRKKKRRIMFLQQGTSSAKRLVEKDRVRDLVGGESRFMKHNDASQKKRHEIYCQSVKNIRYISHPNEHGAILVLYDTCGGPPCHTHTATLPHGASTCPTCGCWRRLTEVLVSTGHAPARPCPSAGS